METLNERYLRPRIGQISADRVAISGSRGIIDLFEGGNLYYRRYTSKSSLGVGSVMANQLADLRISINQKGKPFLFFCVPNKATCLPENYPLWLPTNPTAHFFELETLLGSIQGNVFASWMRKGVFSERRRYWLETDSHWTALGARDAAARLVNVLGLTMPPEVRTSVDADWGGDLCGRWGSFFCKEDRARIFGADDERELVFDNGNGLEHSAHGGRFLNWKNRLAPVDGTVAIVGDSFSGVGTAPEHLTYWFSMLYRNVFFFHGASVPADFFERVPADLYVLQTNERFLPIAPVSETEMDEYDKTFKEKQNKANS